MAEREEDRTPDISGLIASETISYRTRAYLEENSNLRRASIPPPRLLLDTEYARHLETLAPIIGNPPQAKIGDVQARRDTIESLWPNLLSQLPPTPEVEKTFVGNAESHDGHNVPLFRFSKKEQPAEGSSAIVYTHGGGYFCLSVEAYSSLLSKYVDLTGVPIFAVDYRLPPEHPFPAPLEDCFAALEYVHGHHAELGLDPRRIAMMGDSAGGGLCAGTAILARKRGVSLAKHIVIGGNLDDRTVSPNQFPELASVATWRVEDNVTGWDAYLGGGHEFKTNISAPAAPSRLQNASGMSPLYLDVPGLDILRDEGVEYASRLMKQGVEVELHVWPGVPHSFEIFAPECKIAQMAVENRRRAMLSF